MKQQFSLVYLTTPNCSPPEMIYLAARAGFGFVSLRTIAMGLPGEPDFSLSENSELLARTRHALKETGIGLHDIENARIFDGVDVRNYVPEMNAAAELGARYLLSNIWTPNHNLVVEKIAELCDLAEPFGLTVILEFVTWSCVSTITDAAQIIKETGRKNLGIVLDVLHFNRSRCSLADLEKLPPELFKFIHLCDAPARIPSTTDELIHAGRADRLYPGEGGIDIAAIIKRTPPMVYGIEIPNQASVASIGIAEHVFRSIEATKAYFARHQL